MLASSTVTDSARAAHTVASDSGIDALLVLSAPPLFFSLEELSNEIFAMAKDTRPKIPIVISFMGTFGVSKVLTGGGVHIPSYPVPRRLSKPSRGLSHTVSGSQGQSARFRSFQKRGRLRLQELVGNAVKKSRLACSGRSGLAARFLRNLHRQDTPRRLG